MAQHRRQTEWRLKTNEELEEAINNENIVRHKIQTTGLVGACRKNDQRKNGQDHIQMETVCNKTEGKAKSKWEDDVRNDLRKMGVNNWKQKTQERKKWKEIIEQGKTHKEL